MILTVGGERYPTTRYMYGGAWSWNFGGGRTVAGTLLCGSIGVQALLKGRTGVTPLLSGETRVTPLLLGDVEIDCECGC